MKELKEFRCPECNRLLCKFSGSDLMIEILCTSRDCKRSNNRVREVRIPHPLGSKSPAAARASKAAAVPERN
jgi:phage FluMu protein Com